MLYYANKLHSSTEFEINQDTKLWGQLVPKVEQLDASFPIWKFWIVTDLFHPDHQSQTLSLTYDGQPAEMVVQTAASYLRIQSIAQRTVFTIVSPNQEALENLAALIANLYAKVTPISLDKFLENEELLVRAAKVFEPKTGDDILRTFAKPVSLGHLKSYIFPNYDWPPMSLSTIPDLEGFPEVQELRLTVSSHQACFFVVEEEQFSSREELPHMNSIFELTDKIFSGEGETSSGNGDTSQFGVTHTYNDATNNQKWNFCSEQ